MGVIANLVIKVTASVTDFEKQIGSLEKSFARTGAKLQSVGRDLTTGLTLPLAAIGGSALKMSVDFDTAMTKVRTLASESDANIKKLRQSVLDLSPSVGIGPAQLADALLAIESTGFRGADAMGILEMSAKGSAIGMGNTTDIARALTAAVNAYGSENLSAAQAADILTSTVDAGGAEASELATEIGRVVGVAAQLGVSFDQVGAFIATYTKLGLNAAEATTGLSGVLNMILNPSNEARDALKGLGMSAEGLRAAVKDKGLDEALIGLLDRAKGNGDAIGALFGNVRALAGVMGTAGSQANTYRQVLDQIQHSTNTLNERFAIWKTTTAATWKEFTAQVQVAGIQLGDKLAPAFSRALQAAAPVLDAITKMIQMFGDLPQPVQSAVIGLGAFAAAAGPITYAVGTLMTTGSSVLSLFNMMPSLMGPATAALGGMAAAFGTLTGAVVAFGAGWAVGTAIDTFTIGGLSPSEWIEFLADWRFGLAGVSAENVRLAITSRNAVELPPLPGAPAMFSGSGPVLPQLPGDAGGGRAGSGLPFLPPPEKISAYEQAVRSLTERLNGSKLVETARQWIDAIGRIGGIGALTHDELNTFQEDITKAVEKMRLMGEVVPNTWNIIAESTANAVRMATIYAGLGDQVAMAHHGSGQLLLESTSMAPGLGLPAPTPLQSDKGLAAEISGWANSTGRLVTEGFRAGVSQLGTVIMGALQGGGNVGASIGGLMGGSMIGGLASKLTGGLGSMFGSTIGGALGSVIPGLGTLLGSMIGPMIGKLAGKIWGGIQGIFGTDEEAKQVNPNRDKILSQFGDPSDKGDSGAGHNLAAKLTEITGEAGGGALFAAFQNADTMTELNSAWHAIQDKLEQATAASTASIATTNEAASGLNLTLQGSDDALKALGETQDRITATMLAGFDSLIAKLNEFIAALSTALGMPMPTVPGAPALAGIPTGGVPSDDAAILPPDGSSPSGYGDTTDMGGGGGAGFAPGEFSHPEWYGNAKVDPNLNIPRDGGTGHSVVINAGTIVGNPDELAGFVLDAIEGGGDPYEKARRLGMVE